MATVRKPRIRKIETVRERNEKLSRNAETDTDKVKKRPIRRAGRAIARPVKAVARPFNKRPVRFIFRILGKILLIGYFLNSYKELRQVTWPSRRETWKLTVAVLIFATIFGFLVALTDYGLDKVIRRIVLK